MCREALQRSGSGDGSDGDGNGNGNGNGDFNDCFDWPRQ